MTTTARPPLTRDRIIDAAVAYADRHGVDELSMRKLGSRLGVEAMSLYNHVDNKDDILDGMIDRVFSSIDLPDPATDWRDSIRSIAVAAMARLTEHPWLLNLVMQREKLGPGGLEFMDHVIGILRNAGFSDVDTHHAWQMLASHTMGYAFQHASGAADRHVPDVDLPIEEMIRTYPNVAALLPYLAACEFESEYEFGLEIIIDGLESRLS